ncbi:MAG: hypothetical protein RIS70_2752 [Planctomycetota bacterium]|jgi:hypothetical protein
MLDFEVHRASRRCAASDRELQPGEPFYSVLVPQGGNVVRLDYSRQAWKGPPENAIGWWQARVPDQHTPKVQWAPNTVMLQYFEQLIAEPDKHASAYVLALLLIRRRILRQEDVETDEQGQDWIKVFSPRSETHYRIQAILPEPEQAQQIQESLSRLLQRGESPVEVASSEQSATEGTGAAVGVSEDEARATPSSIAPAGDLPEDDSERNADAESSGKGPHFVTEVERESVHD